MIRNFRHKGLKRLYEADDRTRLPSEMTDRIASILSALDVVETAEDMNRPSLKLHPLKGDRKGFWAVTVRANWRIIFRIENGHVHDVDFLDYH